MTEWVIDTTVIAGCSDLKNGWANRAIALLEKIYEDGRVCVDHDGKIVAEYYRYLAQPCHALNWWIRMQSFGKVQYYDGNLPEQHKKQLKQLRFHDDDFVFVSVAMNSVDKRLVSEDSDYSPAINNYLLDGPGVEVLRVVAAYKKA